MSLVDLRSTSNVCPVQLPSELLYEILFNCHRNDIASFALASTTFRAEAENMLYRDISLEGGSRIIDCSNTLSRVTQKARLVHSFCVWLDDEISIHASALSALRTALPNMEALQHLRFLIRPANLMVELGLHFKLKTLFVSGGVDLQTWLPTQTDLKFLGISSSPWSLGIDSFNFYQTLVAATLPSDPLTIGIYSQAALNCITAFPAFSESWDAQLLARSLDSVPGRSASDISMFQIYVRSLTEEAALRNAVASIAHYFPAVTDLQLFIRNRDIHEYSETVASTLSALRGLTVLHVKFWVHEDYDKSGVYQQRRHDLAQSWAAESTNLTQILFPDWMPSFLDQETGVWGPRKPHVIDRV